MRYQELMELSGVKKFATMDHGKVIDYLEKTLGSSKFKALGSGSYGTAVLVGSTVYKFWMVDSAYTRFVQYAKENASNPFMPKFLSDIRKMPAFFMRDKEAPDWVNYVKVEPLTKMVGNLSDQYIEMPYKDHAGRTRGIALDISTMVDTVHKTDSYQECLQKLGMSFGISLDEKTAPKALRLFLGTLWELKALSPHFLDLHEGNFMMRGNQLVIIDPLKSEQDAEISNYITSFVDLDKKEQKASGKKGVTKLPTNSSATPPQ